MEWCLEEGCVQGPTGRRARLLAAGSEGDEEDFTGKTMLELGGEG